MFLECNPAGEWAWLEHKAGEPMSTRWQTWVLVDGRARCCVQVFPFVSDSVAVASGWLPDPAGEDDNDGDRRLLAQGLHVPDDLVAQA